MDAGETWIEYPDVLPVVDDGTWELGRELDFGDEAPV